MRVRRVEIMRSPGVSPGFSVDGFADGLTIIEGRNESGKSTLAGAIRALLWPQRSETLQARGEFAVGDRLYHAFVDVHGGGWEGEAPAMPDAGAGRGMIVGIGDLWHADDHDKAIREAMIRELQGGYDLAPLHEAAQARSPTAPMRDAREAERALADARSAARSLLEQEATLPGLREAAERGRPQAYRKPLLERALERLDLLERVSAARHELAALPAGALRVDGKEAERLASLREASEDAERERASEAARVERARAGLGNLGLPAEGVSAGDLRVLGDLSSELQAIERQLADAQRQVAERESQAEASRGGMAALDEDGLARLEAALTAAHEARERRARAMAAAEDPAAPTQAPSRTAPLLVVAAMALLAAVVAGVALAWAATALAGAAAVLALAFALRGRAPGPDAGPDLRARAEASDAAYQRALAAVREFAGADEALTSTLAISVAADRAARHASATAALLAARAGVESLRGERHALLERGAAVLRAYSGERCESADDLDRQLGELEHRARECERLSREASEASERAERCGQRAHKAQRDYSAQMATLGLSEDRLDELAEWLRLREPAQRASERVRQGEAQLQALDASLRGASELLDLDRGELLAGVRACDEAQERAGQVHQDIGGIEGAIGSAKRNADVGRAIAAFERAAGVVADARDQECAKAARRLILEHAVAGMEREDRPAIVRQADELLARFTAQAYGLRIGARSEPEVYDQRSGMAKGYAALSTGTRAQALLAMRLASAFEAERRTGATLPLVLDEPLATTDDERFEAVARAMFGLAHDGRQVVYLTCEPAHAHRLERLASEHDLGLARLDLDAIRGRASIERNPSGALLEPRPQPSPATVSREAYLRWRGVEPLDPWSSVDAIDLYHLLPAELETLHALKVRGMTTVGQVRAQAEREGAGFPWPEVARRCACACRMVRAWRVGRARGVTTRDLIDSGAVSDTYLERVAEANAGVGGSAAALLDALDCGQVRGFRSNKTDQLRDYLSSIGLLPTEHPAPRESLLQAALGDEITDPDASGELEAANRLLDLLQAAIDDRDEAHAPARA
jgi:ABC-type multidrug transport system fused ATPase/permease subunit